jgi:hypothetical protein
MNKKTSSHAVLSKSTFIRGMQCEKSLYLHKKRPFLRDPLSPEQRAKFSRGTNVGVLAHALYPGGVNATPKSHFQMAASAAKTAEWIAAGENIIYEAAFQHDGVIIALDILVKEDDGWKAVEVKSSRAVSETYLWDAALQYHVITGNGIELSGFFVAYMDETYEREGALDAVKMFQLQDVLADVRERAAVVQEKIGRFKEVIQLKSSPDIPIGLQCHDPYPCDFIGHCWKKVPAASLFELRDLPDAQKFELYRQGIAEAADVPEAVLSSHPQLRKQVDSLAGNRIIADKERLKLFFERAAEPLVFFTALVHQPAVPLYDGSRPYELQPFSLGISYPVESGREPLIRVADPLAPMDAHMLREVLDAAAQAATVVTFDAGKQQAILEWFVAREPSLKEAVESLKSRMCDLQTPFVDYSVIWPGMHEVTSPEVLLRSLGKKLVSGKGKPATRLEAALLFQELAAGTTGENNPAALKSIAGFHEMSLLLLKQLWDTLNEIFQGAE